VWTNRLVGVAVLTSSTTKTGMPFGQMYSRMIAAPAAGRCRKPGLSFP
jgi:hypothetical protein